MKASVKLSTGRTYLEVDGTILVVQGDLCRDPDFKLTDQYGFKSNQWDTPDLEKLATMLNRGFGNENKD